MASVTVEPIAPLAGNDVDCDRLPSPGAWVTSSIGNALSRMFSPLAPLGSFFLWLLSGSSVGMCAARPLILSIASSVCLSPTLLFLQLLLGSFCKSASSLLPTVPDRRPPDDLADSPLN